MPKIWSTLQDIFADSIPFLPCNQAAVRMTQPECEFHVAGVFMSNYYLKSTDNNEKAQLRSYLAAMGNKEFMLSNSVSQTQENTYIMFVKKKLRGPEINKHFNSFLDIGEDELRRRMDAIREADRAAA